jgi:hypothetical protein
MNATCDDPIYRLATRKGRFLTNELFQFALRHVGFNGEVNYENFRRHVVEKLSVSQRAMLICRFNHSLKKRKTDVKQQCIAWVKTARGLFAPGERRDCQVCGMHKQIAQPHHIYPLAMQFWDGLNEPIQDFVWLCPNHHAIIHNFIDKLIRTQPIDLTESFLGEFCLIHKINTQFVNLRYRNGVPQ